MSVEINTCYANPTTQLWGTPGNVVPPTTIVGTEGTENTTFYVLDGGASMAIYDTSEMSFVEGAYLATISIEVSQQGENGSTSGGLNQSLYLNIAMINSIGTFVSGAQYYFDTTQDANQDSRVMLVLPFASAGDDTDLLGISITGGYDYPSVNWNITTYCESIQFITPSPVLTETIFG